jgi:hypothetical protein
MRTDLCALAFGPNDEGRCEWDGRPLPVRHRKWCSDECSRAYSRNHFWSTARPHAVRLADGRCDVCGSDEDIEVHHVRPVSPTGGYGAGCQHHQDNLLVLCALHHVEAHAALRAPAGTPLQMRLVA